MVGVRFALRQIGASSVSKERYFKDRIGIADISDQLGVASLWLHSSSRVKARSAVGNFVFHLGFMLYIIG
jgi:hypothetical protein